MFVDDEAVAASGNRTRTRLGGHLEAPAELEWVWRGYDPAKTADEYIQDPTEKGQPFFRVKSLSRYVYVHTNLLVTHPASVRSARAEHGLGTA